MTKTKADIARSADRRAREMVDAFAEHATLYISDPHTYAQTVLALDDAGRGVTRKQFTDAIAQVLPAKDLKVLVAVSEGLGELPSETHVQLTRWRRGRRIFAISPEFYELLRDTEFGDEPIPAQVLRAIAQRYPDPMIVLPEPIYAPVGPGPMSYLGEMTGHTQLRERYDAFLLQGGRVGHGSQALRCSSAEEDITQLQMIWLARIVDEHDRPVTGIVPAIGGGGLVSLPVVESMRVIIDVSTERTFDEHVQFSLNGMMATHDSDPEQLVVLHNALVRTGIVLLSYLASDSADIDQAIAAPERKPKKRRTPAQHDTPATVLPVGYRIAAQVHQATTRPGPVSSEPGSQGSVRSVRPHTRRAHMRNQPYGPGRSLRKLIWVPPSIIRGSGGEPAVTEIRIPEPPAH